MRPLVPGVVAFILGINAAARLKPGLPDLCLALAVCVLAALLLYIRNRGFSRLHPAPAFFFLGALFITPYISPKLPQNHLKNVISTPGNPCAPTPLGFDVRGVVAGAPERRAGRTRLYVDTEGVLCGKDWKRAAGRVMLTVQGELPGIEAFDRVRYLTELREPWNYGNPGGFDYMGWLSARGIFLAGFVKNPGLLVKTGRREPGAFGAFGVFETARGRIEGFIDGAGLTHPGALKALITGERGSVDRTTGEAFTESGTAHILAISGLHMGMVALFSYVIIMFALRRSERLLLRLNARKTALALSLVPVVLYGALSGWSVSASRSVVMVCAFALSFLVDRGRDYYNTLALAALAVLCAAPYAVWDAGFQLSFAAVFSILYIVPRLKRLLPPSGKGGRGRVLRRSAQKALMVFLVTLAASAGTWPVLAWHFNRVSPAGLLANLAIVPIAGVTVPAVFLSALLYFVSPALAALPLAVADVSFGVMLRSAEAFSSLPYSSVWVSRPGLWEIALFYALVAISVNLRRRRSKALIVSVLVAIAFLGVGFGRYNSGADDTLRVNFISVGQGDSALVEFPNGRTMLVDGGGTYGTEFDVGRSVVGPLLRAKGIRRIDYMVLSHAQRDHMEGLGFIADNLAVGEFWWNGDDSAAWLVRKLKAQGTVLRKVDSSTAKSVIGGVVVEILNPAPGLRLDTNNLSVVLRLGYGERRFLFTGDIGSPAESLLSGADVASDVLKAPHHGSRYSSSRTFLDHVHPSVVVVSAGRYNSFGFPHAEALGRYARAGALTYRTDRGGMVTVTTDGNGLDVTTYLTEGPR